MTLSDSLVLSFVVQFIVYVSVGYYLGGQSSRGSK